ncbi:helix-turn-helix transcriptional regulator [Gymnodinialimonas ceratoperidinii]|uniref:AlpA family phage regulatory protein n=1 Tax=Gymnodinialimonas ceratoperidinii TaxID=2856823 RepID=A0A8F6TYD9_9RHOB|nr:AlpA family phage regulatory protein [Gymnodinialimonas ceratoperidinii]QXT40980.1 AlpA family phage regulatory protein [Gymnodinialimonas ceratoperidinii]
MKLLTKKQVREKVGFSFAHIDRMENAKRFPQRVKIGFRVFWSDEEIEVWITSHLNARS